MDNKEAEHRQQRKKKMLGLKNLFNKKEKIQNVETFRKDYYEKNIIPEFNKYWNDEFVCEKLGLKSLAEGKVTVKNDLTVEDICMLYKVFLEEDPEEEEKEDIHRDLLEQLYDMAEEHPKNMLKAAKKVQNYLEK